MCLGRPDSPIKVSKPEERHWSRDLRTMENSDVPSFSTNYQTSNIMVRSHLRLRPGISKKPINSKTQIIYFGPSRAK
ncbi:unnamed protein product [Fasciola hepatica]|uniref:Uncharacterized protein n=1 Tax=Fasciola hepatica TaxID=6192 RepID=A0ABC9HH21_FASHE|nr:unnamed protein product [Fasciola hepatica]